MATVDVTVREHDGGWIADVTVKATTTTTHRVRVSRGEHERFGGGDVQALVRRSFEFLLARESNTSILREFRLGEIKRYFPEYEAAIRSRG